MVVSRNNSLCNPELRADLRAIELFDPNQMKKKKNRIYVKMYVCTMLYSFVPCTLYLPYRPCLLLLFQGVSASDLPTKTISLIPTKAQIKSKTSARRRPPIIFSGNFSCMGEHQAHCKPCPCLVTDTFTYD